MAVGRGHRPRSGLASPLCQDPCRVRSDPAPGLAYRPLPGSACSHAREGACSKSLPMMSASMRSISGDRVFMARPPGAPPVHTSDCPLDSLSLREPVFTQPTSVLSGMVVIVCAIGPSDNGDAPCVRRSRAGDITEGGRRTSRPVARQARLAAPRGGTWASRFGPAILPGVRRNWKPSSGRFPRRTTAGCWFLHHPLTTAAGFLDPGDLPSHRCKQRLPGNRSPSSARRSCRGVR